MYRTQDYCHSKYDDPGYSRGVAGAAAERRLGGAHEALLAADGRGGQVRGRGGGRGADGDVSPRDAGPRGPAARAVRQRGAVQGDRGGGHTGHWCHVCSLQESKRGYGTQVNLEVMGRKDIFYSGSLLNLPEYRYLSSCIIS